MACPALVLHEEVRWEEWEDRVEEDRRTRPISQAARAASVVDRGIVEDVHKHMDKYVTPCMPTIFPAKVRHREKLIDRAIPLNLIVARPVGRQ